MDEFRDSDISSLLNQVAGSSPDTMAAHSVVLGKVRRVRQRRMATVGAAAVVMVISGAVAMVQNSQNRDGGSNIAVPLSPDDSEPVKVATNDDPLSTTTTIDRAGSIDPTITDPPVETPSTQPLSNTTMPGNTDIATTAVPTNTQAPTNSIATSTFVPTTPAPLNTAPTTRAPSTPTTQAPISLPPVTVPPVSVPEIKTWSCGGGEVDYRVTSSGLVLIDTRPAAGFTASEKKAKGDEITVKFIPNAKNDERKSSLKIKKSRIVSTSCNDEDFDRRSDSEETDKTDNNDESADD
jgi:hypothetical protein